MRVNSDLTIIDRYNKEENISIFTNNKLIKNLVRVETIEFNNDLEYKLFYDNTDIDIEEISDDLIKTNITLPDYDCFCIVSFNGTKIPLSIAIDRSYLKNIFFYIKNFSLDNSNINYNLINPLGDILSSDHLIKLDGTDNSTINASDIYYVNMNQYLKDNKYCIMEIENKYYNLTPLDDITKNNSLKMKGEYIIQPDRFQMIAIPKMDVNIDYFLNLVQNEMSKDNTFDGWTIRDVLPVIKAYPSNLNSFNKYQVYVPTASSNSAKFNLIQQDNDVYEIVPFFIKTGKFKNNIKIKWES